MIPQLKVNTKKNKNARKWLCERKITNKSKRFFYKKVTKSRYLYDKMLILAVSDILQLCHGDDLVSCR